MDYKNIFSPETLAKLNKKSADNLRQMLGDKSLMQTLQSSQQLLNQIAKIEAPYKQQLEKLAVDMVKELYPIINEEGIIINAKLGTEQEIGNELNEIKVNDPTQYKYPLLIQNQERFDKWKEYIKNKYPAFKQEEFEGRYLSTILNFPFYIHAVKSKYWEGETGGIYFAFKKTNESNMSDIINQIKKLPKDKQKELRLILKNQFNINENISPESRRRIINGITQGASVRGAFAFYLFKEHLDKLDPTLVQKYSQLMKEVFGIYDDPNAVALMLSMLAQGHKQAGGSSKVIINEIGALKHPNSSDLDNMSDGFSVISFNSINGDKVNVQIVNNPYYSFPSLDIIYNTDLRKIINNSPLLYVNNVEDKDKDDEDEYFKNNTPEQFKNVASLGFEVTTKEGETSGDRKEKSYVNNAFHKGNEDFLRNQKMSADDTIKKWVKSYKKKGEEWDIEFKNPEWNNWENIKGGAVGSLQKGIERWLKLTDGQKSPNYLEWKKNPNKKQVDKNSSTKNYLDILSKVSSIVKQQIEQHKFDVVIINNGEINTGSDGKYFIPGDKQNEVDTKLKNKIYKNYLEKFKPNGYNIKEKDSILYLEKQGFNPNKNINEIKVNRPGLKFQPGEIVGYDDKKVKLSDGNNPHYKFHVLDPKGVNRYLIDDPTTGIRSYSEEKYLRKLNESENSGITIKARALNFPMLVHEIIKGLYELISLQGFKGNKTSNQQVVDKIDTLENEPEDLKYGKFIYDALNNIFADSNADPKAKEFFFIEVYQLENEEFISLIENAINESLTSDQKWWVKSTLKDIEKDLKEDEFDKQGLNEIKVNAPIHPSHFIYGDYNNLTEPKPGQSFKDWVEENNAYIAHSDKRVNNYSVKIHGNRTRDSHFPDIDSYKLIEYFRNTFPNDFNSQNLRHKLKIEVLKKQPKAIKILKQVIDFRKKIINEKTNGLIDVSNYPDELRLIISEPASKYIMIPNNINEIKVHNSHKKF